MDMLLLLPLVTMTILMVLHLTGFGIEEVNEKLNVPLVQKKAVEVTPRQARDALFQTDWTDLARWERDHFGLPHTEQVSFVDMFSEYPNMLAAIKSDPELFGIRHVGQTHIYTRGEMLAIPDPFRSTDRHDLTTRLNLMVEAGESTERIKQFVEDNGMIWHIMEPAINALDKSRIGPLGVRHRMILPHWENENNRLIR